ncbi:rhamnogalacturonate lyase B-like [Cynara cardunculus var. scolymus]|uniref:rhamnogalacturonate lyase B-like n=1 Tax=Cynara cardunculus var. scolymus TaxID=59895 RepID=UPI000D628D62|nr:rhamnogalacturonate lyase B-like [Cynara cardunculus var. scolymus]
MHPGFLLLTTFSFYVFSSDELWLTRAQGSSMDVTAGVNLSFQGNYVVISNGIVKVTLSNPQVYVTGIQYDGIDNLLDVINEETNRGYWDVVWSDWGATKTTGSMERLEGTHCDVIVQTKEQVELSFSRTWTYSNKGKLVPLKIDKRFILLHGSSGFYTYAILEHLAEWPSFNLDYTRLVFKLRRNKFHYMVVSDYRKRDMPSAIDRTPERSQILDYPEAVLLVDPIEPRFKGEVDDKYQYTSELKDLGVHGWISNDPPVGFWHITPSNEFKVGGPTKSELTSHVGPTTQTLFSSAHYGGNDMVLKFGRGEWWKKVLGPIFIYLNTVPNRKDLHMLWDNAKNQMSTEVKKWPYDFLASKDFQSASQRGAVTGRLLVLDRFITGGRSVPAKRAYVGLAPPGDIGSWQRENKKYQFWTETNEKGHFSIPNVIAGKYNLYAWVPGFIGDFRNSEIIDIASRVNINLGDLLYEPPRDGPTLWEIGVPDRTAAEFFIPDPNPKYLNKFLLIYGPNRYRQYGLWDRYTDLNPYHDLVYTVGQSNYTKDFFFAHVLRRMSTGVYVKTTWTIRFSHYNFNKSETYVLRLALASAHEANIQVRINDLHKLPLFSTGIIGRGNAIARHGIHGLYWLFNIEIPGTNLYTNGVNCIYLTQANNGSRFQGVMYNYIRLEARR